MRLRTESPKKLIDCEREVVSCVLIEELNRGENRIIMAEPLDLFSSAEARLEPVPPMTGEQRAVIRALFAQLHVRTAREQFDLVDVLIGIKLHSVADLDTKNAAALIPRLRRRAASQAKTSTGNSWSDREENTWIDNL